MRYTQSLRRPAFKPSLIRLEDRTVPAVTSFGANPQHTGYSAVASQPVQAIHWQATVDAFFTSSFGHYGAPIVTYANTVIYPFKTGSNPPNFHIVGRNGGNGTQVWDTTSDWVPTDVGWFKPNQPVLATATNRVYYPGAGGTVYYRTDPDSATGTIVQIPFFGTLSHYQTNKATYDANVFIDTPLSVDNLGNIYFGFRANGSTPTNLISGIARVGANGATSWVSAQAASGDANINQPARDSAMALSNDGTILYAGVRNGSGYGRLVGLNAATLATQHVSSVLKDPRNNNDAQIHNFSTASPTIAPDGRVFYGVLGSPNNGFRGWLLQFSPNLVIAGAPGGFGWDNTVSIVPASMVPQYTGTSTYLLFSKDNNYNYDDGDGSNKIAILDPNDTEVDTHSSAPGQLIMKRVLSKLGPTPDSDFPGVPTAVREWCINSAAVDPATSSVLVNNEDGKFYRWYLPTNTLTEGLVLTVGIGQPYTMSVIGLDGTIYGIADGIMFAMGKTPALAITDTVVANNGTTASFAVTLDYPRTTPITVNYATANGSAVAGTHYTTTSGMLTFNPGEVTKTINVAVNPSNVTGTSADFVVNLTSPSGALMPDAQGLATLLGRPPRVQGVVVNDGSAQRSRVTKLTVNFNQIVGFTGPNSGAFVLTRQSDGAVVGLTANPASGSTNSVELTFTSGPVEFGSLSDGRFTLTVLAAAVSNIAGSLDGNGNGVGGDDYILIGDPATNKLYRYFGDADGDGDVDNNDFIAFRSAFGNGPSIFDADGDGDTDLADFGAFRGRFGTMVP